MEISIVGCLFVLNNEKNLNNKKNDLKSLKIVVTKEDHQLITCPFSNEEGIKETIKKRIGEIIGCNKFHLEQIYTFGEKKFYGDNRVDILYLALTNAQNIKQLDDEYTLVNFEIIDNSEIVFDNTTYAYKTVQAQYANSLEYYHLIDVKNLIIEKELLEILTIYKSLRFKIDNTDICFKLLPDQFTLEDVRNVYELVKGVKVDKSNFRKRIVKYCKRVDSKIDGKGYRPSQLFEFDPDTVEIWL